MARLRPHDLTVTLGALFPGFLIYEYPGPWAGLELGWQLSRRTRVVGNVGLAVTSIQGSQRYFLPLGVSLRAAPWKHGPWLQLGLSSTPWLEHIAVALPGRKVSTTDAGATFGYKVQVGVQLWDWDLGLGTDGNLLPSPFYSTYKGDEALPWDNTWMVWLGRRL